jgi:hypothetical protein
MFCCILPRIFPEILIITQLWEKIDLEAGGPGSWIQDASGDSGEAGSSQASEGPACTSSVGTAVAQARKCCNSRFTIPKGQR